MAVFKFIIRVQVIESPFLSRCLLVWVFPCDNLHGYVAVTWTALVDLVAFAVVFYILLDISNFAIGLWGSHCIIAPISTSKHSLKTHPVPDQMVRSSQWAITQLDICE